VVWALAGTLGFGLPVAMQLGSAEARGTTGATIAGYSASVKNNQLALSTAWPDGAAALVPATRKPPSLSGLSARGGVVKFKLSEAASVSLVVSKRKKTVLKASTKGRKGADKLKLKSLKAGTYVVSVTAGVSGRGSDPNKLTSAAQVTLRVASAQSPARGAAGTSQVPKRADRV
jgi:hypothetical protein